MAINLTLNNESSLTEYIERVMLAIHYSYKNSSTDAENDSYRVDKSLHEPDGAFDNFKFELKVNYRSYAEYKEKNKIVMKQFQETFIAKAEWMDEYCRIYLNLIVKR